MKRCRQCGFLHQDREATCIRCGARLDQVGHVDPLALDEPEHVDLRPVAAAGGLNALQRLRGWLGRRLYIWRERLASPLPAGVHHRNPWVAGWLALLPGAGQLYNRQPRKALLAFGCLALCLGAAAATFHRPCSNYILLGCLLAMLYAFHDGVTTAKRINRDYLPWQHMVAFYFAWILYVGLFCIAGQFALGVVLIKFRHITHDEMRPWLRQGERIALDRWTYLWRKPRVGDIVYVTNYSASEGRTLELEKPGAVESETLLVRPRNYIERVVGAPGDTFERRAGTFYRNGRPVPPGEQPLVRDQIPLDFSLTAPPGKYLVLMSYTGSDFDPSMAPVTLKFNYHAPRMNSGAWIAQNWPEVNAVPPGDIHARTWFVYNPPPARRWLR